MVCMLVPALVAMKGGDALSVCFNTIAIVFLMEMDNMAFSLGLSERVRARVENAGRVDLNDAEAVALVRMKVVHATLIVALVVYGVLSGADASGECGPCGSEHLRWPRLVEPQGVT
jgi:hypothetical protein